MVLTVDAGAQQPDTVQADTLFTQPIPRYNPGDMNAGVQPGSFPGSIRIGSYGGASLGIGGFVQYVAVYDTDWEGDVNLFAPAAIGVLTPDNEGQFGSTAARSQLTIRSDVEVPNGTLVGYVEFDFVDRLDLRQALILWAQPWGVIVAGKSYSTFQDPDAVGTWVQEPVFGGYVFRRTELARYTRRVGDVWRWSVAVETPSSDGIYSAADFDALTVAPDVAANVRYQSEGIGHVQLSGLFRPLRIRSDLGVSTTAGWGVQISAKLNFLGEDEIIPAFVFGRALSAHMLGLSPFTSSGWISAEGNLETRRNWGGYLGYKRRWSGRAITSIAYGYADAERVPELPPELLRRSHYVIANVIVSLNDWLTMGPEYVYGRREDEAGNARASHRFMFGIQAF